MSNPLVDAQWFDEPGPVCEYSGHIWEHAGGGLYICMQCEQEAWSEEIHEVQDTS